MEYYSEEHASVLVEKHNSKFITGFCPLIKTVCQEDCRAWKKAYCFRASEYEWVVVAPHCTSILIKPQET